MSLAIFPVFQPPLADLHTSGGEFLASEWETIDRVASEHGLPPLSAFSDQRAIPEDFAGSPDELDDLLDPSDQWFQPAAAVHSFRELLRLIQADSRIAQRFESAQLLAEELEDLIRVLDSATARGAQFRLELG